ncbi:MAG: monovalent cation/H+ antiporter complex subunit F [Defluviitaleaceae bacterium]|nr:monovalent cation/H+ antiporter complex subunit F [Defluviitaleaceae bacterium]MCL2836453.1 monovalent cation/H+ antiporter complex subunit F [Defluviitaleaceae bacterium]
MYAIWVLLVYFFLYVFRLVIGPSVWDRLLAMNIMGTKIIMIIVVYASVINAGFYLDFAIIYALSAFVGTIFIALFLAKIGKKGER